MERHSDHRFDLIQINFHTSVIISNLTWFELLIIFTSAVDCIELFNLCICLPDRRQAGGLCGHYVHADTEISA